MDDTSKQLMQGVSVGEYNSLLRMSAFARSKGLTQDQAEDWFAHQLQPAKVTQVSGFTLGAQSVAHLDGVLPKLVEVVRLAITLSTVDFTVYEGIRSLAQQRINVAKGVSKTMDSQHIRQADGFGHAVDLVPWIQGHPVWDWTGCYKIAYAMDQAATHLNVADHIRWGGDWDQRLSDFGGDEAAYMRATTAYQTRHKGPDFLDGPHFEYHA